MAQNLKPTMLERQPGSFHGWKEEAEFPAQHLGKINTDVNLLDALLGIATGSNCLSSVLPPEKSFLLAKR